MEVQEYMLHKMGELLSYLVKTAQKEGLLIPKDKLEKIALERMPEVEFSGDDWIWDAAGTRTFYPSETASIALTQRDENGNIVRTGIAALYPGFPAVLADKKGAYVYRAGRARPIIGVDGGLVKDPTVPLRVHIFGQKATPHWIWMNLVIAQLNALRIRTDNNMGPYFLIRDFFFSFKVEGKGVTIRPQKAIMARDNQGITIKPLKAVISEPFANKPKEEIGAFVIWALNKGLPLAQRFVIRDMSGAEVFEGEGVRKLDPPVNGYKAFGWIAGPDAETVTTALKAIKEATERSFTLESVSDNKKVRGLLRDLARLGN